ncbi:SRPBCC family protein [Noviherbaspirillum denitrificans]|uniref:BON domain-containing protein n=1 Tax=Noviherbaspirillum denitrificans TaxID=1968433 RepID=A0A254TNW6_9BURK|nr:SRPBCC family protein [Noviherbaspirillum denitrificans]OWW21398.1 hypothetical protein AYR66_19840 [Noviherbaspirillum denitrificans]
MREEYESESNQSRLAWMLGGLSLGALAMYLADPERGPQRRAQARDAMRGALSSTGDVLDVARRDLGSRVQGWRAQADTMLTRGKEQIDDQMLKARVRQKLIGAASQPGQIDIEVNQGTVTLSGTVPKHERQYVLDTVRRIDGVNSVQDFLDTQQDTTESRQRYSSYQEDTAEEGWSPSVRTIVMLAGSAIGLYLLTQRSSTFSSAREPIILNKTIHVDAAPERVFEMWSNYENFPRFMSNVQEVRDLGNGRSHWVVKGPAGTMVEWDARLTDSRRSEVLAWQSEADADIQNSGQVRFEPEGKGTRVSVYLSYTPPGGGIGHAIASLFGSNPKQEMDEDLARMKSYIETGAVQSGATQPTQSSASILH